MDFQTKREDKAIQVIAALSEKPKLGPLPADLVLPWSLIAGFSFLCCYIILSLDLIWFLAITAWLCGAWLMLAGNKSYEFTDRLVPLPGKEYTNLNSLFVPATDIGSFKRKMSQRTKSQTRKTRQGKKEKLVPFQIESDLHAIMQIRFENDEFAVLLRCDGEDNWSASIPLAMEGIHPELSEEKVGDVANNLTEALKDIPFGESLTLMLGCRSHYRRRMKQLENLSKKNKLPIIGLLLASEEFRVKETTQQGFRQEWTQYAFATWTRKKQALRKKNDLLGKFANSLSNFINSKTQKFTNTQNSNQRNIYIELAQEIYENGYHPWKMTLSAKAKLNFRPLKPQEIWEEILWFRFNEGNPPPIPQLVTVTKNGKNYDYQVTVNNPTHPKDIISVLLEGERGKQSCPQHHSRRDLVAVKDELVATMSMEKAPDRWPDHRHQLRWIWEKLSDTSVRDTEIWLEISNGDKALAHENLIKISKQSTASNLHAREEGAAMDVKATLKQEEALEAQARLFQGAEPLLIGLTAIVYRKTPKELNRACNRLANSFGTAKLIRETKICWKLWTETFPFNCQKQLKSTAIFTERRPTLDSTSTIGVLPISKPQNLFPDGFELINREGGYPIYIDLFKNSERAIIMGKAGSGKSLLSFELIRHALAQNISVVGMDMSNAGESTFELITNLLGDKGAYINIVKHSFNILQPPNLSKFDSEKRKDRMLIWQNSTTQVLVSMAMGQIKDQELLERVESTMIRLMESFFRDATIVERYNLAFEHGWKSPEWQNMPVLEDLLFFCSKEKLGLYDVGGIDERAINQINNQISAKLIDPNIGNAISKPSNISPDPIMKFFALSGLSNENNAYIMALVAQLACLNTALSNPKSLFVIDECSVLFKKRGFADIVGERFATGRKEGQTVLVIGQDIEAILDCSASSQITTNTDLMLIGKTTVGSAQTYHKRLQIPWPLISRNTSESFKANKQFLFSHWLVCRDEIFWESLFFPSLIALAVLANSSDEKAARDRVLQQYPNTTIGTLEGVGMFSQLLRKAYATNTPLSEIGLEKNEKLLSKSAA